jgi:hypothetical protein
VPLVIVERECEWLIKWETLLSHMVLANLSQVLSSDRRILKALPHKTFKPTFRTSNWHIEYLEQRHKDHSYFLWPDSQQPTSVEKTSE